MSTHIHHPPMLIGGLVDGCPRCVEHADHPYTSLDDEHLKMMLILALQWDDGDKFTPRSTNELVAFTNIMVGVRASWRIVSLIGEALDLHSIQVSRQARNN